MNRLTALRFVKIARNDPDAGFDFAVATLTGKFEGVTPWILTTILFVEDTRNDPDAGFDFAVATLAVKGSRKFEGVNP